MGVVVVAADGFMRLKPDPAWMVSDLKPIVGGVLAVCIVLSVGLVIMGVITMMPGMMTGNMMERAFSWRRLVAALLIPMLIGSASSALTFGFNAFGSDGLAVTGTSATKQHAERKDPDKSGLDFGTFTDDLGGLVQQLGHDIVEGAKDTVQKTTEKLQKIAKNAKSNWDKTWDWLSGGDGKGNFIQKAAKGIKQGATGAWNYATGNDGTGKNIFQKAGDYATGNDGTGKNIFQKAGEGISDAAGKAKDKASDAWDYVSGGDGEGNIFEKIF